MPRAIGKSGRVFVVTEEYIFASILAEVLSEKDLRVHPFSTPVEALKAARRAVPSLLVAQVPFTPLQLALAMRERCPSCNIILFSSHAETNCLLDSAAGFNFTLLPHPILLANLLNTIQAKFDATFSELEPSRVSPVASQFQAPDVSVAS